MGTGDRGSSAAAGRPSAGSKNNYSRMLKRKTVGLRLLSFFVICIMSLRLIQKSSVVLVESPMAFVELTVPSQNISRQAVLSTEELPGEKEYSRRLFLGIFTSPMYDMRLRNMIRTTYLQINAKLENGSSTEAPLPKICSLPEFSLETSSKSTNGFSTCQIIYSFIAEGEFNPKYASEVDMLFLNMTNENKENEGSNIVYQLYDYILNSYPARVDGTSSSSRDFRFDFVAYTHCRVVLYPHRLWPREMFGGVSSNTTKFSVYSHPRIYSRAVSSEKPDNKRNLRTHGYTLLSITLLETVMRHPSFHSGIAKRQTLKFILEQIIGSSSTIIGDDSSTTKEVPATSTIIIPLKDSVYIYEDSEYERYSYMPFITQWDAYKDTWLVTYEDPEEEARVRSNPRINHTIGTCQYGPRILLGIFTTKNDAKEIKRRTAIRETYLRSYLDSDKRTANDTIGSHRICSLANLLSSNHPEHSQLLRECQIAYTFVAGGNPDGPTERVEFNISEPMILPTTSHDEKDLVLLNIRENMKQGKSQSFFKYATSIVDEHIYFDYIAKTDSDTLIYPEHFLNHNINQLPKFPDNVRVYAGSPRTKEELSHLKGPIYNQGLFYWMSIDLARYITSRKCDRQALKVWSEDKSIGNFVHSHPLPIHRFKLKPSPKSFDHPVKQIPEFRNRWKKYLAKRKIKEAK